MTDLEALFQDGVRHHHAGRIAEAERVYRQVLAADAHHAGALYGLGGIALKQGRLDAAAQLFGQAVAAEPDNPSFHAALGAAFNRQKKPEDAEARFRRAVTLKPDYADAYTALARIYQNQRRTADALESFQAALKTVPDDPDLLHGAGVSLMELQRPGEALPYFSRIAELLPDNPNAHYHKGLALQRALRFADALPVYARAVELSPMYPQALGNLGVCLQAKGRLEEAMVYYQRAIAALPTHYLAYMNLGNTLSDLGRNEEALAQFTRALELSPGAADVHTNLIFALNFAGADIVRQQDARRRWYDQVASRFTPAPPPLKDPAGRKIRVGYVGPNFRHQAATYAFAPVILHHDRARFEVAIYSDTAISDDITERFKEAAALWRDTTRLSDDDLAAQIRADGIDILVDCVGHMQGHRLLVFARKPAPIQVTAWGEPTGTGLPAMDYLLADPVLAPEAERPRFAEKIADLPCFIGYWSPEELPPPGPLPAMSNGYVTFASFNRAAKLTAPTLELWAGVLKAVPGSKLLLKYRLWGGEKDNARVTDVLSAHGIDPARIDFRGETGRADHFAAYAGADIALDPLPHGGGMTTFDALWMGLPVIALKGNAPSARLAASVLTATGCGEWIAKDADDYVAKCVSLAADLPRLAKVRMDLRAKIAGSAPGDPLRYTAAVEEAYLKMVAAHTARA